MPPVTGSHRTPPGGLLGTHCRYERDLVQVKQVLAECCHGGVSLRKSATRRMARAPQPH